jgi:hypothetical protein
MRQQLLAVVIPATCIGIISKTVQSSAGWGAVVSSKAAELQTHTEILCSCSVAVSRAAVDSVAL